MAVRWATNRDPGLNSLTVLSTQQVLSRLTRHRERGCLLDAGPQRPACPPPRRLPGPPLHLAAGRLHQLPGAAAVRERHEVCGWSLPPRLGRLRLRLQV